MFPDYFVRDIKISPGLVLSPMSGVTTSPFRRLIKELNPGAVGMLVSEFISCEALSRKVRRSLQMMQFREGERPFCIQIFGYDPYRMAEAARMVEDSGADIVDINCGCPAPKVVKKGGGCELMRQPQHLVRILKEVRSAVSIPLTLKMRSGWDSNSLNAIEIAKISESEGCEALAIHGRTRVQLYRGQADWDIVEQVANQVKIPVLGSGDVIDRPSADVRMAHGISGLFIGRGALANPFVFTQVMTGCKVELRKEPGMVLAILERYIELLREDFPETSCVGKIKQLVSQMCKGHEWRKELCRAKTFEEQRQIMQGCRDRLSEQQLSEIASVKSDELVESYLKREAG